MSDAQMQAGGGGVGSYSATNDMLTARSKIVLGGLEVKSKLTQQQLSRPRAYFESFSQACRVSLCGISSALSVFSTFLSQPPTLAKNDHLM